MSEIPWITVWKTFIFLHGNGMSEIPWWFERCGRARPTLGVETVGTIVALRTDWSRQRSRRRRRRASGFTIGKEAKVADCDSDCVAKRSQVPVIENVVIANDRIVATSECEKNTQRLVFDWCLELDPGTVREAEFPWCKSKDTGRAYPFDLYLPSFKTIVEVDGRQHFVAAWNSDPAERCERDVYKMRCVSQNGLRVVRLVQEDVWKDQAGWKTKPETAVRDMDKAVQRVAEDPDVYVRHWTCS
ncbi:hypothetical protein BDZ88DRAFT_507227 [Geranomyces variabilis]|nr:hypothetical protein BDZ88DRAFT_507227 [Geranomyces variabilis]KAJ3133326.1 hypothetical protein HDU90_006275 [Geranomyces variabilis]